MGVGVPPVFFLVSCCSLTTKASHVILRHTDRHNHHQMLQNSWEYYEFLSMFFSSVSRTVVKLHDCENVHVIDVLFVVCLFVCLLLL